MKCPDCTALSGLSYRRAKKIVEAPEAWVCASTLEGGCGKAATYGCLSCGSGWCDNCLNVKVKDGKPCGACNGTGKEPKK